MSACLSCVFTTLACQTTTHTPETPALLIHSERSAPKSVKEAVKKALGGREVILGFDSFTKKSTLIVETGSSDPRMMGDRHIPKADYFDLIKSGSSCYMVHRKTGIRYKLKNVNCRVHQS